MQSDAEDRELCCDWLQREGLHTVTASTASEGLLAAGAVDLIVTGVLLPGSFDGIELVARLRRDRHTAALPIVVLTSCSWPAERERAVHAGCSVFLSKPCTADELKGEVKRLLQSAA